MLLLKNVIKNYEELMKKLNERKTHLNLLLFVVRKLVNMQKKQVNYATT